MASSGWSQDGATAEKPRLIILGYHEGRGEIMSLPDDLKKKFDVKLPQSSVELPQCFDMSKKSIGILAISASHFTIGEDSDQRREEFEACRLAIGADYPICFFTPSLQHVYGIEFFRDSLERREAVGLIVKYGTMGNGLASDETIKKYYPNAKVLYIYNPGQHPGQVANEFNEIIRRS